MPGKTKGCQRETNGLLYIDEHILKIVKPKRKYVFTLWIDCKEASGIVLQTWIIDCLFGCLVL